MEAKAIAKFIRISPTKVRRVIDTIRGKQLQEAIDILDFTTSTAAAPVKKTLLSAAANAENNYELNRDELWVRECFVDGGMMIKRIRRGSMGRGSIINKRTSHITIVLADREEE